MPLSKYRKWAKAKPCMVRIDGVCNRDRNPTLLAHLTGDRCLSSKQRDVFATLACSACHDVIDGRVIHGVWTKDDVDLAFYEGMVRTIKLAMQDGLIIILGDRE